jgi:3-oxoadipate enol-lactonase
MTISKMKARDGAELAYEVRGRTKGAPPIALIHSLAMDHTFWNAVTPALTDTTAVLVYDCRGHGRSDKPDGPYRVEAFADDLADLLDHVGWRSAVVAGASMGGCITLAFAAAYPQRAAGLGLFDTTAWYDAPDKWEERAHTAETKGLEALLEFQPRAGSPMPSAPAARTCSTSASPCSSPIPRRPMPRPAACSAPAT